MHIHTYTFTCASTYIVHMSVISHDCAWLCMCVCLCACRIAWRCVLVHVACSYVFKQQSVLIGCFRSWHSSTWWLKKTDHFWSQTCKLRPLSVSCTDLHTRPSQRKDEQNHAHLTLALITNSPCSSFTYAFRFSRITKHNWRPEKKVFLPEWFGSSHMLEERQQ